MRVQGSILQQKPRESRAAGSHAFPALKGFTPVRKNI